jgi:hypothetical protein
MFDNLFFMLGPTTLALVLAPLFLALGIAATVPRSACPAHAMRGARPFAP